MAESSIDLRKSRFKRFAHFFSGLLILLHGFERYEDGHGTWSVFVFSGLIFILLAAYHHQLASRWAAIDGVFFLIEAFLSFVIMGEFIHAGKQGLPYMYLLAGLCQVSAAWLSWRMKRKAGAQGTGVPQTQRSGS